MKMANQGKQVLMAVLLTTGSFLGMHVYQTFADSSTPTTAPITAEPPHPACSFTSDPFPLPFGTTAQPWAQQVGTQQTCGLTAIEVQGVGTKAGAPVHFLGVCFDVPASACRPKGLDR